MVTTRSGSAQHQGMW